MKDFKGKTTVITGAGSGLGRSFAVQLFAAGADLALCDVDMAGLEETRQLCGNDEQRISLHRVDVSDRHQMQMFAGDVMQKHAGVDILINNAGISLTPEIFEDISHEQFERLVNINMWGVYHGLRTFLPHLKKRPEASIINISSLAGLVGLYGYSAYSLSKSAVRGLTEALQSELYGSGVSILLVHPGGIKTNIIKNAPNLKEDERMAAHEKFLKIASLDPDQAVKKILLAVRRKKNRLILGMDAKLVFTLKKCFPRNYPKVIQTIFSQEMFK
ncbi:MAG: SDR family oxidoreductase [Anaerolineaceae bacterium]|nr:SDR family oxidoreductase [Anaerolineaceae bacterium]